MRKKLIIIFTLSVLGSLAGYVLTNSSNFGICALDAYKCREIYNNIGDPLFYGMVALSIVLLILSLIPSAFSAWKKFAIWSVPLMVVIFTLYKGPGGGFMDPTPYPKQVFLWLSILFVVVSVIIITVSFKNRNKI